MDKNSEDYIYYVVANNIKKYRKEKGITQAILAEGADLSHEFIRRIESKKGVKKFTLFTVYKISKVLDIPVNILFIDEDI